MVSKEFYQGCIGELLLEILASSTVERSVHVSLLALYRNFL